MSTLVVIFDEFWPVLLLVVGAVWFSLSVDQGHVTWPESGR